MTATGLLEDLRRQGARVEVDGGDLVITARRGIVTPELRAALADAKSELVTAIRASATGPFSPLVEYAAKVLPKIKMTIRETGDTKRDFDLVGQVRAIISEFQPGGNHIYLTIVTLEGRRVVVEWRALAGRDLRVALGRLLARTTSKQRSPGLATTRSERLGE
jgi:TubC N-terminal docking domain